MLDTIFLQILNMSFTASFAILFVCAARLCLKKAPTIISYSLWLAPLFRLICPVSFKSAFSLIPVSRLRFPLEIVSAEAIQAGASVIPSGFPPATANSATATPVGLLTGPAETIWLIGIAALTVYSLISLLRLRQRLVGAVQLHGNIYLADHITMPFVFGVIHPIIYLPSSLPVQEQKYIIFHEQTHIRRLDHIVKIIAFAVLCVHWFNPLVWAAFLLTVSDMEMSCDENVMKHMDTDIRAEYAGSLLNLAAGRKPVVCMPLTFGGGNTKSRIKNVLRYKKPAWGIIAVSIAAAALLAAGLTADPQQSEEISYTQELWRARTPYIGNNSAVGKLLNLLPASNGLQYDHFELRTDERPYNITIVYSVSAETLNKCIAESLPEMQQLHKNSLFLFALIDNADNVNIVLTDGKNDISFSDSREWADGIVGRDIRYYAASSEQLQELIDLPLPALF